MKIATVGRGNIGGGLADKWEEAGHEVTRIGKDGGDVSDAEVVLVAVPGGAVADALDKVQGIEGKTVMEPTCSAWMRRRDSSRMPSSSSQGRTGRP
jgi:8-hydroxy-5-deazaflavin:NADPH oxidoreductase